jgi:hypothetical protein
MCSTSLKPNNTTKFWKIFAENPQKRSLLARQNQKIIGTKSKSGFLQNTD